MSWKTSIFRNSILADYNRATYELAWVTYLTHRYGLWAFDFFAICKYFTCTNKCYVRTIL